MQEAETAADMRGGDLSGDAKHRRVARISGRKRCCRVEHTRSGHHEARADAAACLRIAEGHVGGRLFVARVDDANGVLAAVERVENIVELQAGQAEDGVDTLGRQRIDKSLGAGRADLCAHAGNLIVTAATSNAIRGLQHAPTSWCVIH